MRDIIVQEPVKVTNSYTGEVIPIDGVTDAWSMFRYLATVVLPDPAMGKGYRADKARAEIEDRFRNSSPGDVVTIDEAHWEALCRTIEEPTGTVPSVLTKSCLPFQQAVMEAKRST